MTQLKMHDYFKYMPPNDGDLIFRAVQDGMAPFRLKQIDVYNEFDIDFNEYVVLAGAVLLSGYTFSHSERISAWDMADNPQSEYLRVANAMFKAFRNRADIRGIPSNIVLGEY